MKKSLCFLIAIIGFSAFAQTNTNEQFPVFPDCANAMSNQQEGCFYTTIQNFFYTNYKVPQELQASNYKGNVWR